MSLVAKSRELVSLIDRAMDLPLLQRAAVAQSLVRCSASILVELSAAVERNEKENAHLLGRLMALEAKVNFDA